jgi:hypothetical protein
MQKVEKNYYGLLQVLIIYIGASKLSRVDDKGIIALMENCTQLKEISLDNVKLSINVLMELKKRGLYMYPT